MLRHIVEKATESEFSLSNTLGKFYMFCVHVMYTSYIISFHLVKHTKKSRLSDN